MSDVDRFDYISGGLELSWTGRYVLASDYDALAARVAELEANAGKLPKEPPLGLLVSMAERYNHGLFAPFSETWHEVNQWARIESTMRTMRQLYEEASGNGFWSPENDIEHVANLEAARARFAPAATPEPARCKNCDSVMCWCPEPPAADGDKP